MSCVVGYIDNANGKICIGCDTAAVEKNKLGIRTRNDEKIFQKDGIIFGFVGSCRTGQILKYLFEIPEHPDGMDDMTYLCGIFIRNFIECLKENEAFTNENGEGYIEGEFLMAYRGKLYIIASDFQVASEAGNFCSIGCSDDYAQGAFYALEAVEEISKDVDAQIRVIIALEAAAKFSAGVRPPFKILSLEISK